MVVPRACSTPTPSRIAEPPGEADHQTSAVPDLIGDTNANEHLDDGLQDFATFGPPQPAEAFSTTGNLGPRARENAPTHPGDAKSHELPKEAIVSSSHHPPWAAFLAKLPSMADSIPKGWNTSLTSQHPSIRQNIRLRNHPRVLSLSIKVPSRDEFRVPSQDAPLYSGAEAVTNDGTAAGQCIAFFPLNNCIVLSKYLKQGK